MDSVAPELIRRILLRQLGLALGIFVVLLVAGWVLAYSALIGGLIGTLANAYSARRIFAPYRAQHPEKLLMRFYGTEFTKILLTILMVAGAIVWMDPLSIPAMFGSYIVVQLVPLLVVSVN